MARKTPRYQREATAAEQEAFAKGKKLRGRIVADVSRQAPHNSYGGGRLFYEDIEFTCEDCGKVEVWTAEQQKWWYENAKGIIYSTAKRCLACRNALVDRHAGTPRRSQHDRRETEVDP